MSNLLLIVLFCFIGIETIIVSLLVALINKERVTRRNNRKTEQKIARSFMKTLIKNCQENYLVKEDYKDAYESCYREYVTIFKSNKELKASYQELDTKYDVLLQFIFDTINTNNNGQRFSDDFKKLPTAKIIELFGSNYKAM